MFGVSGIFNVLVLPLLSFSTTGEISISSKLSSFSSIVECEDRRLYLGFFGNEVNCGFGIFVLPVGEV